MTVIDMPEGPVEALPGVSIEEAVRDAGYTPDSFIFLIGGRPVPMDSVPPEGSKVTALRVASGG